MIDNYEDTIIELNGNKNFYVIKQSRFNDILYLFANELKDEDTPSENYAILKVNNQSGTTMIEAEKDPMLLEQLTEIFSNKL